MVNRKYNPDEREVFALFTFMKAFFIAIFIINLFMPLFAPFTFGYTSIFQWLVIIFHFVGLLAGLAYTKQRVLILPIGITRILEVLWYVFVASNSFNFPILWIILILDTVNILFLLYFKGRYKRTVE